MREEATFLVIFSFLLPSETICTSRSFFACFKNYLVCESVCMCVCTRDISFSFVLLQLGKGLKSLPISFSQNYT